MDESTLRGGAGMGMADSSSDYTFLSNLVSAGKPKQNLHLTRLSFPFQEDLSLDTSMLSDSKTLSTSSLLDSTLNQSEIILISSDTSEGAPHTFNYARSITRPSPIFVPSNPTISVPGKDSSADLTPDSETLLDKTAGDASLTLRASPRALPKSPVRVVDGQLEVQLFDTRDAFEAALPETVTVLEGPFGSRVYLIGTAHFSEESQNDVSFVMRNVRPDFVMVELCASRSHIMVMDEQQLQHESTDLSLDKLRDIYRNNGLNSIFYVLLLRMSSKLTKELGCAPGCEFRRAFAEVKRVPGCTILLGDRPIALTIQRLLRTLGICDTLKLVWRLLTADDTITAEDVEACKDVGLLEKLMEELAADFPQFNEIFVRERDLFMAYSLQNAAMPVADEQGLPRAVRVVGVVGIGHAAGIKERWGKATQEEIRRILEVPQPQLSKRVLRGAVKWGFYGLVCYGAYRLIRPRLPANFRLTL